MISNVQIFYKINNTHVIPLNYSSLNYKMQTFTTKWMHHFHWSRTFTITHSKLFRVGIVSFLDSKIKKNSSSRSIHHTVIGLSFSLLQMKLMVSCIAKWKREEKKSWNDYDKWSSRFFESDKYALATPMFCIRSQSD